MREKYFVIKYFYPNRFFSFNPILFLASGLFSAENFPSLAVLLILFLSMVYIIRLYYIQKNLFKAQSDSINKRLIKIERENLKLKSEFIEHIRQNNQNEKLFSIISHDLRSPVTAILNTSEIFRYYINQNKFDKLLSVSEEIDLTVRNMSMMLDNLLNWHLTNTGKLAIRPTTINMHDIFNSCSRFHSKYAYSKSIEVTYQYSGDIFIYADYDMILEAIKNITCNAIKYSRNNSIVIVTSKTFEDEVEITISDKGTGIPEEVLESLETGFTSTPVSGTNGEKGCGLGLLISKQFVIENGGKIFIESKKSKGTKIRIKFPLAVEVQ